MKDDRCDMEDWYVKYEGTGEISGPMPKAEALQMFEDAGGIIFSGQIFEPQEESHVPAVGAILDFWKTEKAKTDITSERVAQLGSTFSSDSIVHRLDALMKSSMESLSVLCQKAIDDIISVSQQSLPKPEFSSKQIETLVVEMRSASTRVVRTMAPSDNSREMEGRHWQELLGRAVDVITLLSHPPAEVIGLLSFLREEKAACDDINKSLERSLSQGDQLVAQITERVSRICEKSIEALVLLSREKVVTGEIQGGVLTLTNVPEGVTVDITDNDDF